MQTMTTEASADPPDYMTRDEALAALGIKAPTLYAYVSRGQIESRPIAGSRAKLFSRRDIELLRSRSDARSGFAPRGQTSMKWGEPIITTAVTELTQDAPKYRGRDAIELSRSGCTFEAVSQLLWSGEMPEERLVWNYHAPTLKIDRLVESLGIATPPEDVLKLFSIVVLALGLPQVGLDEPREGDASFAPRQILQVLSGCCGYLSAAGRFVEPEAGESIARIVCRAYGVSQLDRVAAFVNAALIICADFELTPGAFGARVAASAGADIFASIGAGLCAHSGVLTGRGADMAEDLLMHAGELSLQSESVTWRKHGRKLFGFNHTLFPKGDPRALALIDLAKQADPASPATRKALAFLKNAIDQYEAYPGLAVGLVVFCAALGLPRKSASALWAIGRTAGHIAHILEQRADGSVLRPRARYEAKSN